MLKIYIYIYFYCLNEHRDMDKNVYLGFKKKEEERAK